MAKTVKADEKTEETFEATEEWGRMAFHPRPGTHTVILDVKEVQQRAIAGFLKEVRARGAAGLHGQIGVREAVAVALGKYDVPMELIFSDDENLRSEFDLDDTTLAQIVRMRHERKTSAESAS